MAWHYLIREYVDKRPAEFIDGSGEPYPKGDIIASTLAQTPTGSIVPSSGDDFTPSPSRRKRRAPTPIGRRLYFDVNDTGSGESDGGSPTERVAKRKCNSGWVGENACHAPPPSEIDESDDDLLVAALAGLEDGNGGLSPDQRRSETPSTLLRDDTIDPMYYERYESGGLAGSPGSTRGLEGGH